VPDADAAYARALEKGAVSIFAPEDKPYEERQAGVRDAYGNTWWISTWLGRG
jgi:PhnB protein